jgi:predicted nuclease with TOPRIM domain|tara:strand:- start:183 stop:401 length:219 start_codon:yes stop_codon:yes gene_type:complete
MEVTMHLDGDPTVKEEGFFASKVQNLQDRIKVLEFENAELVKSNGQLSDRVKKLASRQPTWPRGYRPNRHRR